MLRNRLVVVMLRAPSPCPVAIVILAQTVLVETCPLRLPPWLHRCGRSSCLCLPPSAMVCRKPLAQREVDIIRRLQKVMKMPVAHIAKAVDRNKSSIYKALDKSWSLAARGHPRVLSSKDVANLIRVLKVLNKKSRARWEVTMAMLKKAAGCKACHRTVRAALAKKGIKFRKLRTKPLLTSTDRADRRAFALRYKDKSVGWWLRTIHLHTDVKTFQLYTTKAGRDVAAQRAVRGAYRQPGQGLDEAYVVAPKDVRYHPTVRSVKIAGGVSPDGRVILWEVLTGAWNGKAAAKLYAGPVRRALTRASPQKRKFTLLEDNDPTGWKSGAGVAAKKEARIDVFSIPKRSPDLSVMDFAIWSAINKGMRRQEQQFSARTVETKNHYLDRLRKVAKSLPRTLVRGAIQDMRRRCRRLHAARGGHFEEGGGGA